MNSTIQDLRETLFATLRGLNDGSIDIERAKAVGDISQTIINTGKLEVEFLRQTGRGGTGFVPQLEEPAVSNERKTLTGVITNTPTGQVHRMR
jgi:hypothetical protein